MEGADNLMIVYGLDCSSGMVVDGGFLIVCGVILQHTVCDTILSTPSIPFWPSPLGTESHTRRAHTHAPDAVG